MTKFKKRPGKQAETFISGAGTKAGDKKPGNLETLTIRIRPEYLERLRALSYLKRNVSQRDVVETALDQYFRDHKADLERAEKLYQSIE